MRAARTLLVAGVAALALGLPGCGADRAEGSERADPLGPGHVTVTLGIEYSRFDQEAIQVVEGTHVEFVLENGDPIGHELILGPPEVQAAHEAGTHAAHGAVDGEVSVGPNTRAQTGYRFGGPGTVEFACHLPGHYEHGMHGLIEVVSRR
jgi:uncharacterized cupredoxin-like copper-binding protein